MQYKEFIVFNIVTQACRTQPLTLTHQFYHCISTGRQEANSNNTKAQDAGKECGWADAMVPPTPASQVMWEDICSGWYKFTLYRAILIQLPTPQRSHNSILTRYSQQPKGALLRVRPQTRNSKWFHLCVKSNKLVVVAYRPVLRRILSCIPSSSPDQ